MKTPIRLVALDRDAIAAIEVDIEQFARERGLDLGDHAMTISGMVRLTARLPTPAQGDDEPWWGGYLAVEQETARIVGTCAYKSAPKGGEVEIAYFTFPGFEGRGIGTAMAALLVATAAESPEVTQVIAHTLPELNASGTILTRNGFTHVADVIDPEDGPVWRWERAIIG